ncbi:MAG: hypothetical protein IJX81_06340 [Clostridia bacterium]|nr:hypothetical protein [Clostridia bacterium]
MHAKRTVHYYLLILFTLAFFFFTNDFGLIAAQKTAIVTAIAIDKEEEEFSLAVQIANPSKDGSKSGGGGGADGGKEEYPCVNGKGKTVAEALASAEKATGWQVKLVFCRVLVLGESVLKQNCFEALDFFLLDEYMNATCQVTTVNGSAAEVLKSSTPLGKSSALALEKILSDTAKTAGTALPVSLKDFAMGYFGAGSSGFLPLIEKDEDFFKAEKTVLVKEGKKVGVLSGEETFALTAVKNPLRLADYTFPLSSGGCTVNIRKSKPKLRFSLRDDTPTLQAELAFYVGIRDSVKPRPADKLKDAGDLPDGALAVAEKTLSQQIIALHERCKAIGFDVFEATGMLQKYENNSFETLKETLPERLKLELTVRFEGVR